MKHARVDRRRFLQLGAGALLGSGLGVAALPALARGGAPQQLVVVWLQGGADGLSLLPPLRDAAYRASRARTAVPADRVIALGERVGFGLHPAFAPLAPLVEGGALRGLPGVGIRGAPGSHARSEARLMEAMRAVGAAQLLPGDDEAGSAESLALQLRSLGEAIAAGEAPAATLLTVAGFDTHAAQARRLERAFGQLAEDLRGFVEQLGERFADTVVLVVTEQGRGLRENRRAGTEDGVAGAALLLGGTLPAAPAASSWPDLAALAAAGEDALPITVDLAQVLAALTRGQLGAGRGRRAEVLRG